MPDVDFKSIKGPKSSKQDNFQEMCSQLVLREHPETKPVEGAGGDGGVDLYIGKSPTVFQTVWQAKFFLDPLKASQKRQIVASFDKVKDKPGLNRWILCLPRNLNPAEQRWFYDLSRSKSRSNAKAYFLVADWWGESKLRELLMKHPDIALEFFPSLAERRPEDSLVIHGLVAGALTVDPDTGRSGRAVEFMLSNLSNNVLVVDRISLEVLRWEPYDVPPAIEAKIDTFKYFVELHPGKVGEYAITSGERFSYVRGGVDAFLIVCDSPPGNKYRMRLNFYCTDLDTAKKFPVQSEEFGLCFRNKFGL